MQKNTGSYELKKQLKSTQKKSNEERLENLSYFYDNIITSTDGKERNNLYQTIIESIFYQRKGNTIDVKITFK